MTVPPEPTDSDDVPASDTAPHEMVEPPSDEPRRRSSITPLPAAVPYHVADPTTSPNRVALEELSAHEDLAAELETRQIPRISSQELAKISQPPPTVPVDKVDLDDAELTTPRELVAADPLANAFFVSLPLPRRATALGRCLRRSVRAGTTVIREGETSHPLFMVIGGRLELRVERGDGTLVVVDTIDAGQYVGEVGLLGRTASSVQVIAVADSELLALPPHALFELAGAYPQLWSALKDTAERRMRQLEASRASS